MYRKNSGMKLIVLGALILASALFFGKMGWSKELSLDTENKTVAASKDLDSALRMQNLYRLIAKSVTPAVVSIQIESEETVQNPFAMFNDPFFQQFFGEEGRGGQPRQFKQKMQALGSGFIVTRDGYIFSNYHVVKDATKIQVILADDRKFKAKVVGTDPETDIALLKIKAEGLPTVAVGNSGDTQVGDLVIAIGNPFGLSGTYTSGIISFVGRPGMMSGFQRFIQTDAPVNPGNSGGPLVNIRGQVIGINTAIQTQSGGSEGISFAVPINMAKSIAHQLINGGKIERGYMGITIGTLDEAARKVFGIPEGQGVLVAGVEKNGPAAKAGLKRGDIITRVNGLLLKTPDELQTTVGGLKPGSKVVLEAYRQKSRLSFEVVLKERPRTFKAGLPGQGEGSNAPSDATFEFKGVTFAAAAADMLEQNGAQFGVAVQDVREDSPLAEILERGNLLVGINDTEIRDLKDLKAFAGKNGNEKSLVFAVMQNGMLSYRAFEK